MPSLLAADNPTIISYPIPGEDDAGYIEVKAVEDPTGSLRDEIIIVLPLADGVLDGQQSADDDDETDPLYFYPTKKQQQKHLHEGDTDSESDSDDEEDEARDRFEVTLAPESKELEYSFMEELMQTLDAFFGCSYGTACTEAISPPGVVKSILRRKKDSDPCTPPINRNVSFTKLEIREFNMTLGNHPSAVSGPPVMLDWNSPPSREAVIDLDSYEQARKPRRNRRQLKLSFEARRGILERERGFTVEEVKQAWSEALKVRKQRQETRLQGPTQRMMDEFWESACRKYNRLFDWKLPSSQ